MTHNISDGSTLMTNKVTAGKTPSIQLAGQDPDGNRISVHFTVKEFQQWQRDAAKVAK